ncbi:hypothetical protein STSP2_02925 [Anaerohalosphaera lusitana]|uniref:Uncharacterized protein n=1 Tax=Anaerohalosphaera lusitana TaxID=1936003 RepID=A0A1U9NP98_9BACT|nr:hypothetical protein [Anaerohalosphaera lusitana]AQT69729.1 hypothetical protein STSP2_02925 [Anaerohalosphaera lusitana]
MIEEKHFGQLWDNLAFTKLFRSFRLAVGPSKLIIAFGVIALVCLFGCAMDLITGSVATQEVKVPTERISQTITELDVYIASPEKIEDFKRANGAYSKGHGVFSTLLSYLADRFNDAFVPLLKLDTSNIFANVVNVFRNIGLAGKAFMWAIRYHPIYSVIFLAFSLVCFCIAGGAICRCAALEFARGEKPGIFEAIRFSFAKFGSLIATPAIPALAMIALGLPILALGLLANIPYGGPILLGIGLPLALIIGLLLTAAMTGSVFGFNLMFPTIAYQGSDSFDAISRSFMYVLTQPLWMIIYSFIAMVYGTLSYLVVRFFSFLLLTVTYNLIRAGIISNGWENGRLSRLWPQPAFADLLGTSPTLPLTLTESISVFFINLTLFFVVGLIAAFVLSFYFCANTIIYVLLRKKVDGTPTDDVYVRLIEANSESEK